MSQRTPRTARVFVVVIAVCLLLTGCLAQDPHPPTPEPTLVTPPIAGPTIQPPGPDELVVGLTSPPLSLAAGASDPSSTFIAGLIHDGLYRLDHHLRPQPVLAAAQPEVSEDGLTWTIPLRSGLRFHDGTQIEAADAVFMLQLAGSAYCPFTTELCTISTSELVEVAAADPQTVIVTLDRPFAPFLGSVLAKLPILPRQQIEDGVEQLSLSAVSETAPRELIERIGTMLDDDRCFVDRPAPECLLTSHVPELEGLLTTAGVSLPDRSRLGANGVDVSDERYATALLDRVQSMATAIAEQGTDRIAAAFPLLELSERPIGAGPFAISEVDGNARIMLTRNEAYPLGAPRVARIRVEIIAEPSIAVTALESGELDWLPNAPASLLDTTVGQDAVRVAARPDRRSWEIVFNTRRGHVFDRRATRQAFAACLDRAALTEEASRGRSAVAESPFAPQSWAIDPTVEWTGRDPAGLLEQAGWSPGRDGIMMRDDQRLSATIYVRPSRTDLLEFARGASRELRTCGIELLVEDLGFSGDVLLDQIQFPNRFDAVLVSRDLSVDPDLDLEMFSSERITSRDNPIDANFSGWSSDDVDALLERGRSTLVERDRITHYAELQQLVARDVPFLPVWYEYVGVGLSSRVTSTTGAGIDPAQPGYAWNIADWTVAQP